MNDVRLGRVVWLAGVAHVLGGVERLESQSVEEVPWVHQACHRTYLPSRRLPQHRGHLLQLRDAIRTKAETWEASVELSAGVCWVQRLQRRQGAAPGFDLLRQIGELGNRCASGQL